MGGKKTAFKVLGLNALRRSHSCGRVVVLYTENKKYSTTAKNFRFTYTQMLVYFYAR